MTLAPQNKAIQLDHLDVAGVDELVPSADGRVNVSVLISEGATVIDFCGPWEVFQDVWIDGPRNVSGRAPFRLFTVAERRELLRASGGLQIMPDFTFGDAPYPHLIMIPAQSRPSEATLAWLCAAHERCDLMMSICTGAFILARTGLLTGRSATTHHEFYELFESNFAEIDLKRGVRFVEQGKLATAGGLSSGIDLALRVVERYFGRDVAQATADYMEYEGTGWVVS